MPRRDFKRDVVQACVPGIFARLSDVRGDGEDGLISFTYTAPSNGCEIKIQATVTDTSEYPRSHTYFAFTVTDDVPETVPVVLEASQSLFNGLSVIDFLNTVSDSLDEATLASHSEGNSTQYEDDGMDWDEDGRSFSSVACERELKGNIRSDLRKALNAGFRVGYLGELYDSVTLSASCRISKLGISPQAMQAWNVRPSDFLVLLILYPQGYRPLSEILSSWELRVDMIKMRVGVCRSYKPSLRSARQAFASEEARWSSDNDTTAGMEPTLNAIFIGKSLNSLLNERFIHILRYRIEYGYSWTGAELYVNDGQGKMTDIQEINNQKYFEPDEWNSSSPAFLLDDHLANTSKPSEMSLLLIAMQFTQRRFVKCTEFCLNCYCKIKTGFEALKPFVCSNGLCLYQYMALGMGPSLEWEVSSQPYVVDLLVSFTYASAAARNLKDFPTGLHLKVPHPGRSTVASNTYPGRISATQQGGVWFFVDSAVKVQEGDWIALMLPKAGTSSSQGSEVHSRVKDVSKWPDIYLAEPIFRGDASDREGWHKEPYRGPVQFAVYDTDFDLLSHDQMLETVLTLLDTLPGVLEMRHFVNEGFGGLSSSLSQWHDRVSPAARLLLQWIVGSNRSVIVYDDDPQHQVSDMEGYLQFRFAQGAPDKEQRFVASVTQTASRLRLQYPTLFAWHGSPLCNWHSIMREGLHYKYIAHGRSFGNGIYMSPIFSTSVGFCSNQNTAHFTQFQWPHSVLKCSMAISLNEVVNAPAEFISNSPHYVVQNVDWVQPRYLFIQCLTQLEGFKKPKTSGLLNIYFQDPCRTAIGPAKKQVQIPISAVNSHRDHTAPKPNRRKRNTRKINEHTREDSSKTVDVREDDDVDSVATQLEDQLVLLSDIEDSGCHEDSSKTQETHMDSATNIWSMTDFRPGTLQASSIKLLGEPSYATSTATKVLQKQLRVALRTQKKEPAHELGWYINEELITNVYQWIVELHSFDWTLPLTRDLKSAGLMSVVLEIRYPAQFPMSPPFIRIIRPRFLRFSNGGGGHVTAGGAMCMELLTNSGWLPTMSIESVLLQVRMAITNPVPQPARLDPMNRGKDYSVNEAVAEYKRVCICHGWSIPDNINQITWA